MRHHSVRVTRIDVDSLPNPTSEGEVSEEITLHTLTTSITQPDALIDRDNSKETEADVGIYSIKGQPYRLAVIEKVSDRQSVLSRDGERLILNSQSALTTEIHEKLRQTAISDNFK